MVNVSCSFCLDDIYYLGRKVKHLLRHYETKKAHWSEEIF